MTPEHSTPGEAAENSGSASLHRRGPRGLGEEAARALEQNSRSNQGSSGLEEQAFLRAWAQKEGCLIPQQTWESWILVSNQTLEHEVRLRPEDRRAVKKTWPGTFGFVPSWNGSVWVPKAATAAEYLHRMHLQNTIFRDEIQLEGGMIYSGPSMMIGQPPDGFSFVISQPWLEAADNKRQYPSEQEIHDLLCHIGFKPLLKSLYGWQSDDESFVILDAKPDNFIATAEGILPIDLLLTECQAAA